MSYRESFVPFAEGGGQTPEKKKGPRLKEGPFSYTLV